jgi:hypothetical protein
MCQAQPKTASSPSIFGTLCNTAAVLCARVVELASGLAGDVISDENAMDVDSDEITPPSTVSLPVQPTDLPSAVMYVLLVDDRPFLTQCSSPSTRMPGTFRTPSPEPSPQHPTTFSSSSLVFVDASAAG